MIERQIDLQADMLSLNDFFLFSAFAFAAALGIMWLARRAKPRPESKS